MASTMMTLTLTWTVMMMMMMMMVTEIAEHSDHGTTP
jgi:hypothetical protein